jgi:hypothetical protein
MQIRKGKPPGTSRLAGIGMELSREARVRLVWMDFYRRCDNVAHTCRHFGIRRQTFYRWQRRYDPYALTWLEKHSHRPRQCRQPTWAFSLEEMVLGLRLPFPRWGKDKLAVLPRRQKVAISVSMVGRILTRLQQQGRLVEAPRSRVPASRRALRLRPSAVRKPREYAASEPGDLVEAEYFRRPSHPRSGLQRVTVTYIQTHAFWIGPPSTSAQNWRVAGVDNPGASGLWYELVK